MARHLAVELYHLKHERELYADYAAWLEQCRALADRFLHLGIPVPRRLQHLMEWVPPEQHETTFTPTPEDRADSAEGVNE